jgi:peptide/nickel transport system permease protein
VQVSYLLFGAVILENTFDLPGLGEGMVFAAAGRDFPVVIGITLVFAIGVVVVHLVGDVVLAMLDPRVHIE